MPSRATIDVNCERFWVVAERARARGALSRDDVAFVRDTLPGQKALEHRFANRSFFENVERDLALGVMRSHFHHEYPKGTHCRVRCTLAVYPVLEAGAIRYFDCAPLADQVRRIVRNRQWRFARPVNPAMVHWSLGDGQ